MRACLGFDTPKVDRDISCMRGQVCRCKEERRAQLAAQQTARGSKQTLHDETPEFPQRQTGAINLRLNAKLVGGASLRALQLFDFASEREENA
jgi:hypothetical protein